MWIFEFIFKLQTIHNAKQSFSLFQIPQTVTGKATRPASSASPLSSPKQAWVKTRVSRWMTLSSSPWRPPSPRPASTAASKAPEPSRRSSRDSRALKTASAPDQRASPAVRRSQVCRLSAPPCGDLGRLSRRPRKGRCVYFCAYVAQRMCLSHVNMDGDCPWVDEKQYFIVKLHRLSIIYLRFARVCCPV